MGVGLTYGPTSIIYIWAPCIYAGVEAAGGAAYGRCGPLLFRRPGAAGDLDPDPNPDPDPDPNPSPILTPTLTLTLTLPLTLP